MSGTGDAGMNAVRTVAQPDRHWAAVLGGLAQEPCCLCGRTRRAGICERFQASADVIERFEPGRLKPERPARAVICKDCCIATLEGHKCVWWDFCWSI
jgi:hypothetical protein